MTMTKWRTAVCAVVLLAAAGQFSPVAAQARQGRPRAVPGPGPLAEGGVTPGEIQRLFDAYVVMQAQQELQLTDEQYPKFLARVKALQDVRRRGQTDRLHILQDLRRLTRDATRDEVQITAQLKALNVLEAGVATASRNAMEQIDEVLDVRQQAMFRLFEEQMERRKVELLLRARQGNRPKQPF